MRSGMTQTATCGAQAGGSQSGTNGARPLPITSKIKPVNETRENKPRYGLLPKRLLKRWRSEGTEGTR